MNGRTFLLTRELLEKVICAKSSEKCIKWLEEQLWRVETLYRVKLREEEETRKRLRFEKDVLLLEARVVREQLEQRQRFQSKLQPHKRHNKRHSI